MNKKILSVLLVLALAMGAALPVFAQTGTISGTVTAQGSDGKMTISLLQGSQVVTAVTANGSYTIDAVAQGQYILRAEKSGYVTREYELTVTQDSVTQDVKLCTLGDVTGDGKINVADTSRAYAYVRDSATLDAYALACADMTGDTRVNVADVSKIYGLVRNPVEPTPPAPEEPEDPILPIPSNPVEDEAVELGGTLSFKATVQGGHLTPYKLYRVSDTTLVIESPYAYVIYNGVTYEAVDGVVTVPELYTDSPNVPVSLAIGNRSTLDKTFAVTLVYPQGHQMNPIALSNGVLSTYCEAGNSQGVYYSFTASKAGTLTVRLNDTVDCNISITSNDVIGGTASVSLSDNPGSTSLSYKMSAEETVTVCIVMNPINGFNYPEATVTTTVRFR